MEKDKWDKLNKELDDALDSEFGKAKLALRKYISDNKEKVTKDLEQMRELSNRDKQEPLEEVATNLADPNLCKTDNWIAGAKWQAERMYSEEEVIKLLIKFNQEIQEVEDIRGWFEQFKKK